MQASLVSPEIEPPTTSRPPLHKSQDHQRELATRQREMKDNYKARLPRVPRPTAACPRPLTLEELNDWMDQYAVKRRHPTHSERGDRDECDRQFNVFANESMTDTEEGEDASSPPVQSQQIRENARHRPLSPPRTPPHLKGSKLYKSRELGSATRPKASKVEKIKAKSCTALRRPITRSYGNPMISLHHRKGYIRYWRLDWEYIVISYDKFLRDYVSSVLHSDAIHKHVLTPPKDDEDLHKNGPEQLDDSYQPSDDPYKSPWQRETRRRRKRIHDMDEKYFVKMPLIGWKGHM